MNRLLIILLSGLLCACSTMTVDDYANNTPAFVPEHFFQGKLRAHGIVKNRSGQVIRYFNADINASWAQGIGTLDEVFYFNDGEVQKRQWKIRPRPQHPRHYSATANDVVGTAQGACAGNAFNLNYTLQVPYNGRTINVAVNDWMWLTNDKVILNESTLTKFGFKVGSVQLTIIKD